MEKWNFNVKGDPQAIINKLDAALNSFGGFVFNVKENNEDSIAFDFRKPIKYPDQILHRNRTVVKGKIFNTETEKETRVEISFAQHFFMILTVCSVVIFGLFLVVIIPKITSGLFVYLLEGIVLTLAIILWIAIQRKFKRDTQSYKTLIAEILELP